MVHLQLLPKLVYSARHLFNFLWGPDPKCCSMLRCRYSALHARQALSCHICKQETLQQPCISLAVVNFTTLCYCCCAEKFCSRRGVLL